MKKLRRTFTKIAKVTRGYPEKYIVLDIESTGLNPRSDHIVGVAFAVDDQNGFYTTDYEFIAKVLQDEKITKIFHNAVFDMSMFISAGMKINGPIHDTMMMAHVLDPDRPSLSLKKLAEEILGPDSVKGARAMNEWLAANSLGKDGISKAPPEVLTPYACEDAVNTFALLKHFGKNLADLKKWLNAKGFKNTPWDYYMAEVVPLIPVVVHMQLRGVKLDLEAVARKQSEISDRINVLRRQLNDANKDLVAECEKILLDRKIAHRIKRNKSGKLKKNPPPISFNWDSNDHLKLLILDKLKFPCTKKTKKGNPSIDADFLESIQDKCEWMPVLLEYKELNKSLGLYFQKKQTSKKKDSKTLLEMQEGGVIHASYHMAGTATGRFSSSNPNLQNLPKHGGIKQLFVAREGHRFIYADYSQLELRVAAHVSKDGALLSEYSKDTDGKVNSDLHSLTAKELNIERAIAKNINFAIIYNASGWRIAEMLGYMEGLPLCKNDGQVKYCKCKGCTARQNAARRGDIVINKLFGKYFGLKKYVEKQKELMIRYCMSISYFGHMRRLPDLRSSERRKYNHAIKAGFNLPIQSFGASLCKRAMVVLHSKGYSIINQIHDSLLVEVPESDVERAIKDIKATMENIYKLRIPLVAEPKVLTSFEEKEAA